MFVAKVTALMSFFFLTRKCSSRVKCLFVFAFTFYVYIYYNIECWHLSNGVSCALLRMHIFTSQQLIDLNEPLAYVCKSNKNREEKYVVRFQARKKEVCVRNARGDLSHVWLFNCKWFIEKIWDHRWYIVINICNQMKKAYWINSRRKQNIWT